MKPRAASFALLALVALVALVGCKSKTAPPPEIIQEHVAPEPVFAVVEVRVEALGQSSTEVERTITVPIEKALAAAGPAHVSSVSRPGMAILRVEMPRGSDARESVESRLRAAQGSLPEGVTPVLAPEVGKDAVLRFSSLTESPEGLRGMSRALREALAEVNGVAAIEVCGERSFDLHATLDPERLASFGLDTRAVVDALSGKLAGPTDKYINWLPELSSDVALPGGGNRKLGDVAAFEVPFAEAGCGASVGSRFYALTVEIRPTRGADLELVRREVRRRMIQKDVGMDRELPPSALRAEVIMASETTPAGAARRFATDFEAALAREGSLDGVLWAVRLGPVGSLKAAILGELEGEVWIEPAPLQKTLDLEAAKRALAAMPKLMVRRILAPAEAKGGAFVVARVEGDDLEAARRAANEVARVVSGVSGVLGARARTATAPEVRVRLDRAEMARRGVTEADMALTLRAAAEGVHVGTIRSRWHQEEVFVRLGKHERTDRLAMARALAKMSVRGAGGALTRLDKLVTIELAEQPAVLLRRDGQRYVAVDVRLSGAEGLDAVRRAVEGAVQLPAGTKLAWDEDPAR
ncbi:efflux RND transporter permease subunit [Polyangium aurulentum]|uniref:efflux RND transporter permease subunit n=1 Tax=Polyangium aurulentum TaxID=2567896 RepID=UPI0010AE83E9|nr:efflux RND transporter permease subunit [Polyangium aurulentum]UQA57770.1 efflux RND transporter permease subunit [Polyangium aurulentum]